MGENFEIHLQNHDSSNQLPIKLQCDKCEFEGTTAEEVIAHRNYIHGTMTHVNQEKIPCISCQFEAITEEELKKHTESQHGSKFHDVKASQTNFPCIQCDMKNVDNNCLQKYIDDLKLKTEQAEKLMKEELLQCKKEMEKMKREKAKIEKDHETEIKEFKEQLSRSFAEVKQFVEANVKLAEEKETLMGIHKVNTALHEQLRRKGKNSVVFDEEVTIIDEEVTVIDEEELSDDEESVEFNLRQRGQRFRRTSPFSESEGPSKRYNCNDCDYVAKDEINLKGHKSGHQNICGKCANVFKTAALLRQHIRNRHIHSEDRPNPNQTNPGNAQPSTIICEKCDFKAKDRNHLKKHVAVRHAVNYETQCSFWLKGMCRFGNECKFSHESKFCRYEEACGFWPNCKYEHNPCFYQDNCYNTQCRFQHFLGAGNVESQNFLGGPNLKSQRDFPNLRPVWRPW